MSVHTWGESPHGQWLLEIRNEGRYMGNFYHLFKFKSFDIQLKYIQLTKLLI